MLEKQISKSVIDTKKKIGDNLSTIFVKSSELQMYMYGVLFSEKCMVTPNFLFGYQKSLLNSAFSA